jgi:hypothetical protein
MPYAALELIEELVMETKPGEAAKPTNIFPFWAVLPDNELAPAYWISVYFMEFIGLLEKNAIPFQDPAD